MKHIKQILKSSSITEKQKFLNYIKQKYIIINSQGNPPKLNRKLTPK